MTEAEPGLLVCDERELLYSFREPYYAFTIGLDNGLYLEIECHSAIIVSEYDLFKGSEEDHIKASRSSKAIGVREEEKRPVTSVETRANETRRNKRTETRGKTRGNERGETRENETRGKTRRNKRG